MRPEDIKKKAKEARQKEKEKRERDSKRSAEVVVPQKRNAFGLPVFSRVFYFYYLRNSFVLFLICFVELILDSYYFHFPGAAIWTAVNLFIVLMLAWTALYFTIMFFRYLFYNGFLSKPPYAIVGWDTLTNAEKFPRIMYWTSAQIMVHVKEDTSEEVKDLIFDALYLLRKNADKCFYAGDDMFSDARKKWESAGRTPIAIKGSANSRVVWEIYIFLKGTLKHIHKKYGAIEKVEVKFSNESFHISKPSPD